MDEQNILEEENDDFFDVAGDVLAAPFRGVEGAFQGAYNLADYISFDVLPDYDTRFLGTSKTMAGGAVEGISQFATGFIPLFGLAGRAGALAKAGTVTKGVVAGAATDFTFFNGQEARLSNLIQQVPELQNPVTEFLAHDEDEGELEGRMKNVLEGLGLEAVAGVFIKSLKAIKDGRKAKGEGKDAVGQAQAVVDTGLQQDLASIARGPELIDEFDRDIIDEWFEHLDMEASHDEVLGALDQFKPKYRSFLKALAKEDWLGFDYPSQAVDEFVRNPNIYEQFEISPSLKGTATKLVNAGFRGDLAEPGLSKRYGIFAGRIDDKTKDFLLKGKQAVESGKPFQKGGTLDPSTPQAATVERTLDQLAVNADTPEVQNLAKNLKKIIKDQDDLEVVVYYKPDVEGDPTTVRGDVGDKGSIVGAYKPSLDRVELYGGADEQTIVHEMLHGVTAKKINAWVGQGGKERSTVLSNIDNVINNKAAPKPIRELAKSFKIASEKVGKEYEFKGTDVFDPKEGKGLYAFKDLDEFLVAAFTDLDLQRILRRIPADDQRNIFQKIVDAVAELIGTIRGKEGSNLLDKVLRDSAQIISASRGSYMGKAKLVAEGRYYQTRPNLWSVPEQEITSAATSINVAKLPAAYNKLKKAGIFTKGMKMVDIGGGKFDNAVDMLKKEGVDLKVYDPFNRSAQHNKDVAQAVQGGQVDAAISNNVLNVIKERENQLLVVEQAFDAVKGNGKAHFSVYEGSKTGAGKETKAGFQHNKKTSEYIELVEEVFGKGNVEVKNNIITATKQADEGLGTVTKAQDLEPNKWYVATVDEGIISGPHKNRSEADMSRPDSISFEKGKAPYKGAGYYESSGRYLVGRGKNMGEFVREADEGLASVKRPSDLPEFKKGKEDEFLSAIPDKFRGYAEALMVGGVKPRLPQFALETGEDAIVLKELLEQYYTANPDKIDVKGVVVEIDEALDFDYESLGQDIKDIEKSELDKQIRQQSLRDQGHALSLNIIENVEEAKKSGYGTVSVSKLKNSFQQLLTVADAYRKIGRGTAQSLQARRENFRRKKIGLSETESEIEGLRNEFVNNSGNMKPEKMVKRIEEIIDPNDLDGSFAGLFKLAKKAQGKSFLDMPTEYWMNSILSGPRTQMVNIVGNSLTQVMTTLETVAGGIVSGNLDIVKASLASWSDGEMWKEAAKFAKQSFKEQENILDPTNRAFEESARGAITGERVADSFMGRFVSEKGLRSKEAIDAYGNFIRLPGRLLLTTDEFFKQIAYRRAARLKAAMSGINQGIIDPKKLADHINSTVDKVVTEGGRVMSEESLVREASKIADSKGLKDKQKADFIIDYKNENFNEGASALAQYSADEAQYLTFTKELQEGTLGKGLQNLTNQIPFLRLVLPFVRTPTNILSFAFERTPGVFMPGVLKEERSRLISDLKSDDPVEKSRALGKMLTATLTGGTLIDVVANNREFITGGGPKDEKQKASLLATGWKPYSIKIGDTYYSYQRLDPIATIIGTAADIVDTGFRSPRGFNDSKLEHGFAALTLALTRNATNKSYLAGIQMWSNALGDPDRYLEKLGRNYAGSFVPNVMSQMQDYDTQVMKEVNSWKDAVIRKLPFGRGGLDNKRNILGEELIAEQSPEYLGFINPISSSTAKSDPIINEMASLKHAFRQLVPKLGSINLLDYENTKGQSAYDRQLELLKTVKVGGSTLRQTLGKLIKSKTYQNLPTESLPGLPSPRIDKITSVLSRFKKESRKKMLKEFPELDQQYSALTGAQSAFKRGVSRQEVLELLQQTN